MQLSSGRWWVSWLRCTNPKQWSFRVVWIPLLTVLLLQFYMCAVSSLKYTSPKLWSFRVICTPHLSSSVLLPVCSWGWYAHPCMPFFFCNVTCVLLAHWSIPTPSCGLSKWYAHPCMPFFFCSATCVLLSMVGISLLIILLLQCYMCAVEDGRHIPAHHTCSAMLHVCCWGW